GFHERFQITVQPADETDRHLARLLLRGHAVVERARAFRHEIGLDGRVLEDDVLHLGLLLDGRELRREEDQVAPGRWGLLLGLAWLRGLWLLVLALLRRLRLRGRRVRRPARGQEQHRHPADSPQVWPSVAHPMRCLRTRLKHERCSPLALGSTALHVPTEQTTDARSAAWR